MNIRIILVTTLFVVFCAASAFLQSSSFPQLESQVATLMDKAGIPGLSMAIIQEDQAPLVKTFGVRNAETKDPVNNNTIFEAASLTKPVFAYAVCRLAEMGRIDLDKPLDEYWIYTEAKPDALRKKITARHVLTHSTGFRNWRQPRNSDTLSIHFEPGERFSYSGEGFVYLSKVVEQITGKSTHSWIKEMVFDPLGMNHSTLIWNESMGANSASPHDREGNPTEKYKPETANAAASLHTTASDFAMFLTELITGDHISREFLKAMLTTQQNVDPACSQCRKPNSDPDFKDVSWGLGIGLEHTDEDFIWHWGDNGPFKAYFCVSLTSHQGVVYFANSLNGLAIRDQLISSILPGIHPAHTWVRYTQVDPLD